MRQRRFEKFSLTRQYCHMLLSNAIWLTLRSFSDMVMESGKGKWDSAGLPPLLILLLIQRYWKGDSVWLIWISSCRNEWSLSISAKLHFHSLFVEFLKVAAFPSHGRKGRALDVHWRYIKGWVVFEPRPNGSISYMIFRCTMCSPMALSHPRIQVLPKKKNKITGSIHNYSFFPSPWGRGWGVGGDGGGIVGLKQLWKWIKPLVPKIS